MNTAIISIIVLVIVLGLMSIGLGFLVDYLVKKNKELQRSYGKGTPLKTDKEFHEFLLQINKCTAEQKEIILQSLFERAIRIMKVTDGKRSWLEGALPFAPGDDGEALPPKYVDELLKKQTG